MTTSAEQINELIGGYTNLKQYFEGIRGDIDDRLNAAASRWDDFWTIWHVDQAIGSDDAAGNADAPLQTLQEAINRTPEGQRANIRIRGSYDTTRRYMPKGRSVHLYGCDADWSYAKIDINLTTQEDAYNRVLTNGFEGSYHSFWELYNIVLKAKTLAEVQADHPGAGINAITCAIFSSTSSGRTLPGGLMIRYASVDITADPYVTLVNYNIWDISVFSCVFVNPITGRVMNGIAAGTLAADVSQVNTNLVSF